MNDRQEFVRRTVVPSVVTTTIGVTATLVVQGDQLAAGIAVAVLALLAGMYAVFLWINPRLGFLPWLWLRQWQLVAAAVVMAAATAWLARIGSDAWVFSRTYDIVILFWLAVVASVLAGYALGRLLPLVRPRAMPPDAGSVTLAYVGKREDRVGRGTTGPDGHLDAEFTLEFHFGSSAERRSIILVTLQRVSRGGRRLGQVWTTESLPSIWNLGVVDAATGILLNPDGRLTLGSVQNGTVLRLFASDKSDDGSDWFVAGQHYTATAYLEGNVFAVGTTVAG